MAKKNPSGLFYYSLSHGLGKNKTDPQRTDRYLDRQKAESLEGKTPPEGDFEVSKYPSGKYTINRNGEFKAADGKIMKPFFHPNKRGPRIRIIVPILTNGKKSQKNGEIGILQAMQDCFGPYFEGYSYARHNLSEYLLTPKDGNYENMHYSNLKFVHKKAYQEIGSKRSIIKTVLLVNPESSDKEISETYNVSISHVSRVRKEVAHKDEKNVYTILQHLRTEIGIEIQQEHLPIYQALLQTKGALPNLDIAQLLYPQEFLQARTNEEKKYLLHLLSVLEKNLLIKDLFLRLH